MGFCFVFLSPVSIVLNYCFDETENGPSTAPSTRTKSCSLPLFLVSEVKINVKWRTVKDI